jgi:uncharacterized membrane protein YeaQ/YmgE (transglycosylase-associated protein family)
VSVVVWVMIGVALWHLSVLVPDRFYGGIVGALVAAVAGALLSGYLLPSPGIPAHNPPGVSEALWPIPGSVIALVVAYVYGARRERGSPKIRARDSGLSATAPSGRQPRQNRQQRHSDAHLR